MTTLLDLLILKEYCYTRGKLATGGGPLDRCSQCCLLAIVKSQARSKFSSYRLITQSQRRGNKWCTGMHPPRFFNKKKENKQCNGSSTTNTQLALNSSKSSGGTLDPGRLLFYIAHEAII